MPNKEQQRLQAKKRRLWKSKGAKTEKEKKKHWKKSEGTQTKKKEMVDSEPKIRYCPNSFFLYG